jgi:hypothetical protein
MYNMETSLFGYKINLEILILIGIVYLIITVNTISSTCNVRGIIEGFTSTKKKEGFAGANTNYGESSKYTLGDYSQINTSSWSMPNLEVKPGQSLSQGVQNILNRAEQPVPLPEGEMLLFANTPFKPECCPNTYSNSSGCACMTTKQYNYLVERGANNVPYSEY